MRMTTDRDLVGDGSESDVSGAAGHHAFLSYSRTDGQTAERLRRALGDLGTKIWVDTKDMPAAAEWRPRVRMAIEACNAFIFLVSMLSLDSPECKHELDEARA